MKPINSIDELHSILLEMAKAFHFICEEENIPYYMVGGTLLGAVRHKGFIPWDDDMDFGVPRKYYLSLQNKLREKLPPQYSVLNKEDKIIVSGYFKIADNRTVHSHKWNEDPNMQFGVNIDVFPIDYVSKKWKRHFITYLLKIQGYKMYDASERPMHKRLMAYLVKALLLAVSRDGIINFIEKYLVESDGPELTNIYGVYGQRETVPAVFFGKPKLQDFEDTKLYGVECPHDYLKAIYGDYMKLPPKEKQKVHIIDMYWK